jgi:hypothetical protein
MAQSWRGAILGVFLLLPNFFPGSAELHRSTPEPPADSQVVVLVGAGDIADCKNLAGAEATAKLLDQIPGTVMAVGDLAYPDGSKENFTCYDKTWGRARSRTRPAPGNHEFHAAGATPYFEYFGVAAGDPKTGYYSYELGSWHIIGAAMPVRRKRNGCAPILPRILWPALWLIGTSRSSAPAVRMATT